MTDNQRELIMWYNKRIYELEKELREVTQQRDSYAMWMDRSIKRIKEMQRN